MTAARALWLDAPGRAVLRDSELAPLLDGWSRVRAIASAISPGTERLVAMGQVPPEVAETMRCPYMEGSFAFPVKYGYSLVGRLDDGRVAHVLHPHQEIAHVRTSDLRIVPEDVPAERATLAANLETAVTALWDARIAPGERALVVGFGIVGSLVTRLLTRVAGVEVDVLERDAAKRELAESMGFHAIAEPGADYDVAFGASGAPEEVQVALDAVGDEGRVIELSWLGTREVRLQLGGTFHSGRKQLIASQVSHIPPHLRARWDYARRTRLVFALLRDAAFDAHITRTVAFEELPRFYEELCAGGAGGLSIAVRYS
ncbi:MAG TPA: zinc-binding alcohol dehydrogenase [Thermoanaerobaculia bacterium]|nr:zinc-binding alcohol dehydrogenase [Thermoanaerobaculia bacterium]